MLFPQHGISFAHLPQHIFRSQFNSSVSLETQNAFPDTPRPSWDRALLVPGSSVRAGTRVTAVFPVSSTGLIRNGQ